MNQRIRQVAGATLAATVGLSSLVALTSPAEAAGGPPARIVGTVTAAGAGGLGGVVVTALKLAPTGNWAEADNAVTAADGSYQIGKFDSGTYRIRFDDPSGQFETEFYDDQPRVDLAQDLVLKVNGGKLENIDAELGAAANFTGRVTDSAAAGIPGATVTAYVRSGADWVEYQHVTTGADGAYDLGGLPGGIYTLGFADPASGISEFWNDKADLASANSITVTNDGTMSGLDAMLATPLPPTTTTPTETPAPPTTTTTPTTPTTTPTTATPAATPTTTARAVAVVTMPKIKGFTKVGQRLRVTKGAWNPTAISRKIQWLANGKKVKGATKVRLRLTSKLAGKRLTVKVTASAPGMTSTTVKTAKSKKVKR
jgi:hypothetical protein